MYSKIFTIVCVLGIMATMICSCSNVPKKADALIREGQHDKAIQMLEEYIKTNPDDHVGYMYLGDAYISKARKIGGPFYNPVTVDMVNTGLNYYKKSYEIKPTKLVTDKRALAAQMLEQ